MEHAEELAAFFGPALTSYIGQDDKAHVPIGITAANKQAPLLMSLKYKVQIMISLLQPNTNSSQL